MAPNIPRARKYMAEHGVTAMLASSPTNVAYLTGFDCWLYQKYTENVLVLGAPRARKEAFALLGTEGEPLLVVDSYTSLFASELGGISLQCYGGVPAPWKKRREPHSIYFEEAVKHEKRNPAEAVVAALEQLGITRGRVAVEKQVMRPSTLSALGRALPGVQFVDGPMLFLLTRMVKTDAEVELLRKAALINESGLYSSLEKAKVGAPVETLEREYLTSVARKGAIFDHYFYSPDGLWLSGAGGFRLRRGEHTIIDTGCTYRQYFGDMGTTLLVGGARQTVAKKYRTIWETVTELAESVQPGDKPSELMKRFGTLYAKVGLKNTDHQGHGIGLEPREYPIMGQNRPVAIKDGVVKTTSELPIEVGMVISLETSVYEHGEGSYEVERTFRVGSTKLEELTTHRDEEIFVAPSS